MSTELRQRGPELADKPLLSSTKSKSSRMVKVVPAPIPHKDNEEDECPLFILVTTYLGYLMMTIFGHLRDFFGKLFLPQNYRHLKTHNVQYKCDCSHD